MEKLPPEVQLIILRYLGGHDIDACVSVWPQLSWCMGEDSLWESALTIDSYCVPVDKPLDWTWIQYRTAAEEGWCGVNSDRILGPEKAQYSCMIMAPAVNSSTLVTLTSPGHPDGQQLIVIFCNYFHLLTRSVITPDFFDCSILSESHVIVYRTSHTNGLLLSLEDIRNETVEVGPDFNVQLLRGRDRAVHLTYSYLVTTVISNQGTLDIWCHDLNDLQAGSTFVRSLNGMGLPRVEVIESRDLLVVADKSRGVHILRLHDISADLLLHVSSPADLLECTDDVIVYSVCEEPRPLRIVMQPLTLPSEPVRTTLTEALVPHNPRLNLQTFSFLPPNKLVCVTGGQPWNVQVKAMRSGSLLAETTLQDFQGVLLTPCGHLVLTGNRRFCACCVRKLESLSEVVEPGAGSQLVRDLWANSRLLVILDEDYSYRVWDTLHSRFLHLLPS